MMQVPFDRKKRVGQKYTIVLFDKRTGKILGESSHPNAEVAISKFFKSPFVGEQFRELKQEIGYVGLMSLPKIEKYGIGYDVFLTVGRKEAYLVFSSEKDRKFQQKREKSE